MSFLLFIFLPTINYYMVCTVKPEILKMNWLPSWIIDHYKYDTMERHEAWYNCSVVDCSVVCLQSDCFVD